MRLVRRGEPLIRECYVPVDDLTGAVITSECRTVDRRFIATGVPTLQNQTTHNGWFFITYESTSDWPLGDLVTDYVAKVGGQEFNSSIERFKVIEGVTHDIHE